MDYKHAIAAALGGASTLLLQTLIQRKNLATDQFPKNENGVTTNDDKPLQSTTPHPNWQPGQSSPPPFDPEDRVTLDPLTTPGDRMYTFMITAVVPRPIGFVSTISASGEEGNLAPYSYFNMVSHNPPYVVLGCSTSKLRSHGKKDTLVNILETGEFVVNIISEWYIEAANHTCGNFDYGINEMHLAGLHPQPSHKVKPPRVAESAIQFECKLRHTYDIKDSTTGNIASTLVVGEVVLVHMAKNIAGTSPTGKLIADVEKLRPVSRLGGNTYGRTSGLFDLPRPDHEVLGGNKKKPLVYTSNPQ